MGDAAARVVMVGIGHYGDMLGVRHHDYIHIYRSPLSRGRHLYGAQTCEASPLHLRWSETSFLGLVVFGGERSAKYISGHFG